MKTRILLALGVSLLLLLQLSNVTAQGGQSIGGQTEYTSPPPAVSTEAGKNRDILIVTGKIVDAGTKQPIKNAKINFDMFGEELLHASLDADGNYALALNKKELGQPIRLVFKINGYKRFVIKSVDKNKTNLTADIYLEPLDSDEKSNAKIKYTLRDDPFNTMVIKMQ